jgi:hypothetical protein
VLDLTRKLLKKVESEVQKDNINFSTKFNYKQSKKLLVIFKWVLFDISTQTISGNSSYWASQNGITASIDGFLNQGTEYSMHVVDGIYYKKSGQSDIEGLLNYLNSDTNGDVVDYATTQARNDKMLRDITNTFLFFYQKENSFLKDFCSKSTSDQSATIGKVGETYDIPTEDGKAIRNPALYASLSFANRKCLLEYLLNQDYCHDIISMARPANACENIMLDVLASTPTSQQKELLDFFNTPANYAKLFKQIDDVGGTSNYTEVVFLLANMAESQLYSQAYDDNIEAYNFKWYQEVVGGSKVKNVSKVDAIIDKEKGIQFKVTAGFKTRFHNLPPFEFPPCSPFAQVNLAITDQIKYIVKPDGTPVKTGDIITVPAFFLHWVVNNQFKKELSEQARTLLLTVALYTGAGDLVMAGSTAARVWAAADLFFTTASVFTQNQDLRDYVEQKWGQDGIAALDLIDDIGMYVGVAYLTQGVATSIDNALQNAGTRNVIHQMAEDARIRQEANKIGEINNLLERMLEAEIELSLLRIKTSLERRIAEESDLFFLKFSNDELRTVVRNGKELGLPDQEIEDIIFNGCRKKKDKFTVDDLIAQSNFWSKVKKRGYPNVFTSIQDFEEFSEIVKETVNDWGLPDGNLFVQGSSLKIENIADIGDLDVAIMVDAATFAKFEAQFKSMVTSQKVINRIGNGKIGGLDMFRNGNDGIAFTLDIYKKLEARYKMNFKAKYGVTKLQISIIQIGGHLDVTPLMRLK